jgi:hypothetical protein
VFQFYAARGYRYVHLDADGIGPVIWPQFGFDLTARDHKARLRKTLQETGVPYLLNDPADIFAPHIATIRSGDIPIGLNALTKLRHQAARPLPMFIDMENPIQKAHITELGLLIVSSHS